MYYVYIIRSKKDTSLYTGYTNNLKRRFVEHNDMLNISTKHKAPFQLIYYEAYLSKWRKASWKTIETFCRFYGAFKKEAS